MAKVAAETPTSKPSYFFGLDGVRFFAALFVCIYHLGFYAWAANASSMARSFGQRAEFPALTPFAWPGWIGVQIFFLISGFVIAHSANGATPMAFLRSRALRLLPAAWICATITLVVRLFANGERWADVQSSYFRSLILWLKGSWIDGAYWTLPIEIVFYALIFGLLLTRRFTLLPVLAWVLTLVSASFLSLDALRATDIAARGAWFGWLEAQAELLPLKYGACFALGLWIWMAANRCLKVRDWPGIGLAGASALFQIARQGWAVQNLEARAALGQSLIWPMLIWLLALIVIFACTHRPKRWAPRRPAGRTAVRKLGDITYPLYLIHAVVGARFMRQAIDAGLSPYPALGLTLAAVIGLAALVAFELEPRARRWGAKGFDLIEAFTHRVKPFNFMFKSADRLSGSPTI